MAITQRVKEVASIIRRMQSEAGEMPTTQAIYEEVLRAHGDKSCSYRTINSAKQYLKDLDGYGAHPDDLMHIGRSVLHEVAQILTAEGGGVSLMQEVSRCHKVMAGVSEKVSILRARIQAGEVDAQELGDVLGQIEQELKLVPKE